MKIIHIATSYNCKGDVTEIACDQPITDETLSVEHSQMIDREKDDFTYEYTAIFSKRYIPCPHCLNASI